MTRIHITLPDELVPQIDERRGDVPRATWIRRAIEHALSGTIFPGRPPMPDHNEGTMTAHDHAGPSGGSGV